MIGRAVARRTARVLGILLIVSVVTFAIVNVVPGDPAVAVLGGDASDEQLQAFRVQHGLDRPLPERYLSWLSDVVTGDLGRSMRTHQTVTSAIAERVPVSLELMLLTQLLALVVALPIATIAAYREGGAFDQATSFGAFGMIAIPNFMLALLLIYVFALRFNILPATGFTPLSESVWGNLRSLALPVLTLASAEAAVYQRLLRRDMIATLKDDHIAFARTKGLPPRKLLSRHVLRLSSFSVLTLVGINIGRLLGGAVVVETMFALPGVGRLMIQSITSKDIVMLQGVVLFTAVVYVGANLLVDILYGLLDPRHGRVATG